MWVTKLEIATPTFGRFAMTGEDVGNRVCDCHDMLSACLAMTKRKGNSHNTQRNCHHEKSPSPCHCEERSDVAVSSNSPHTLYICILFMSFCI